MDVTIYRGAEEIGGNCMGLHTGQTKILVDFGLPLDFQERSRQEQDKIRADAAVWAKDAHAVFISHSHADHYGLLPVLPKGTPVFMTPGTRMLLDCHPLSGIEPEETASIPVEPRQPFTFRDIAVTAYDVDHSAYGACAFVFRPRERPCCTAAISGCTDGKAGSTGGCLGRWITCCWKAPT